MERDDDLSEIALSLLYWFLLLVAFPFLALGTAWVAADIGVSYYQLAQTASLSLRPALPYAPLGIIAILSGTWSVVVLCYNLITRLKLGLKDWIRGKRSVKAVS